MQIALVSDIHANLDGLVAIAETLRAADLVVCLGDYVGYYCQVNEALDFVRGLNALCIMGNHDRFLLHGCPESANDAVRFGIDYADRVIDGEHRAWLASLPWAWGGILGERSWFLVHGSPWDALGDYLYEDALRLRLLDEFNFDVIAFGQTHRPYMRSSKRPLLINPGSVGQSRHAPARVTAVCVDTESLHCQLTERCYDHRRVVEQARRCGAGDWIDKQFHQEMGPL